MNKLIKENRVFLISNSFDAVHDVLTELDYVPDKIMIDKVLELNESKKLVKKLLIEYMLSNADNMSDSIIIEMLESLLIDFDSNVNLNNFKFIYQESFKEEILEIVIKFSNLMEYNNLVFLGWEEDEYSFALYGL